jgi:uncharacterized protein
MPTHRPRGLFRRRARDAQSEYYGLLAEAGANLERSAELMRDLLVTWPEDRELADEITGCEHEGDRITRSIVQRLHRSGMAPAERNDIYSLAGAIDDVVDDIEEGAQELAVYRIEAPMEQAQELADVLRDSGSALARSLRALQNDEDAGEDIAQIRRLEQEGDRIYRQSLAALFDGGIDPMLIIRWKDVFAILEDAIDRCRGAANILQGIVVKQS